MCRDRQGMAAEMIGCKKGLRVVTKAGRAFF